MARPRRSVVGRLVLLAFLLVVGFLSCGLAWRSTASWLWTTAETRKPRGWVLRGVVLGPREVDPTIRSPICCRGRNSVGG